MRRAAWRRGLGAVLVLAGVLTGGAGAADAQTPPTRTRASIRLVSQPASVAPNGAFGVFLSLTDAPPAGELAVDIYDRVERSADLATAVTDRDAAATFPVVPLPDDPAPTQTSGFAIQVYAPGAARPPGLWTRLIAEPGVYPIRVRLRNENGKNVATFTTTLVRTPGPDQPTDRVDVALLPVIHADPPADPAVRSAPGLIDPSLAESLPPLLQALADHPTVPATFAVTPDTAARIDEDPDATDVADQLRAQATAADRQLLDAPYVDVDPGQLVATGQAEELTALRDLGRQALTDHVGQPDLGTWFQARPVDASALPFLRERGIDQLVLPSGSLTGAPPQRAVRLAAGVEPIAAVVADTDLAADLARATDPVRAAHQVLARLTLLADAQPDAEVVLPVDPRIDPAALGVLLDALATGAPSIRAVPLDEIFADAVPAPAGVGLSAPAPARLPGYRDAVAETSADLASYRSMTNERSTGAADDDRAFTRALAFSASVDLPVPQRLAELRAVQARARERFAGVSIPERDKVTLGSRRARFPLPITSSLSSPVRVVVEFDANDRLDFPDEAVPVTLTGDRTVVEIPVRTLTSGDTPVRITIRSPDGRVLLSEGRYTIRSTAVSGGGLLLTIGAGLFLAIWWGRHWWRARRTRGPRRARQRPPAATAL